MIETYRRLKERKVAEEIDGGFTLIELLIVIVVLGVLAAVVVFSLGGVSSSSDVAACKADGATYNTAIQAYNAQNGIGGATLTNIGVTGVDSNTHFTFTTASGVLQLAVGTAGAVAWTGPSQCSSVQ